MKVNAYRCDNCGELKPEDEIQAILPQPDLFNRLESFPFAYKVNQSDCHCCIGCYKIHVTMKADYEARAKRNKWGEVSISRQRDEELYMQWVKDLSFMLRERCVDNRNDPKKKFTK